MSPTNGTKSTFKGAKTVQTRLSKFINSVVGSRVEKTRSPPKVPVEPTRLVQQQLFAGLTTPAVTDYSPSLHDGGQETVGSGDFSTNCSVKVLQKHSSTFFQGTIQKAPQGEKGKEAALKLYRKAASYPVINTSTVVKCEDGRPLLYFIKGAMFAGMSADKQHSLTAQSINAIKELIATYPPIAPKKDDSRVFDQAEQKRKWRGKGKAYGRYHLMYQRIPGRPDLGAMLHAHAKPKSAIRQQKLTEYVKATTWEHKQVAQWISVLDPEKHQELHDHYQKLGKKELKHLYQGPAACQSGLVLLVNLAVGPHKDENDARDNWTTTNCWVNGVLKGGHIVFPDAELKVAQEPGDLILTHAAVLTHFLEEIEEGERYCNVRFSKKNILRPPNTKAQLQILCPIAGCKRSKLAKCLPSPEQLRKHLEGPPGQKAKLRAMGSGKDAYHFLEGEAAEAAFEQAMAEYEQRSADVLGNSSD